MRMLAPSLMLALIACSTGNIAVRPLGGAAPAKDNDAFTDARRQLEAGHVALAIDGFRQVLRANPRSVDALNALGVAYDRLGRFDLSRRYYDAALQLEPDSAKVRHNLALSIRLQIRMNQEEELAQAPVEAPVAAAPPLPEQRSALTTMPVRMERLSAQEIMLTTRPAPPIGSVTVALDAPKIALAPVPLHPFAARAGDAPRLHVVNAVGRRGQAGRMRHYLAGVGWRAVSVGDSRRRLARSLLVFPAGGREQAEALAATLPFKPRTIQSARVHAMLLLLGRNALGFDDGLRSAS